VILPIRWLIESMSNHGRINGIDDRVGTSGTHDAAHECDVHRSRCSTLPFIDTASRSVIGKINFSL